MRKKGKDKFSVLSEPRNLPGETGIVLRLPRKRCRSSFEIFVFKHFAAVFGNPLQVADTATNTVFIGFLLVESNSALPRFLGLSFYKPSKKKPEVLLKFVRQRDPCFCVGVEWQTSMFRTLSSGVGDRSKGAIRLSKPPPYSTSQCHR